MFHKLLRPKVDDNMEDISPPPSLRSERTLMHKPDQPRAVTFYNFEPAKLLHYSCALLEEHPIQVMHDNRRGTVDWSYVAPTGRAIATPAILAAKETTFAEALNQSKTFCMNGMEFRNEIFRQRGLEDVQAFYAKGGTVVTVGGNCQELNKLFGCNWRYTGRGNYTEQDFDCIPTPILHRYLGYDSYGRPNYPLQISIVDAMLIEVPSSEEALYLPRPFQTKQQFMEATLILESEWYNFETGEICEDDFYEKHPNNHKDWAAIKKREQLWNDYVPPTATPIAIHKSEQEGGGCLIWIGDALDQDTNMRLLLSKLLTTDFHTAKHSTTVNRYDAPKGKYKAAV